MIRFIKKWWDKYEAWSEEEDEEEEEISIEDVVPPDSGLQKVLCDLANACERWAKSKRRSPFLVEFVIQSFIFAFYIIIALMITLLCFGVYYLFVGSIDKDFLLVILILLAVLPWISLLLQLVFCPVFLLSLMDRIFNGGTKIRRMSLTIIRPFIVYFHYDYDRFSSLDYVFDYFPCPCKLYYFPLEDEHKPKTSKVHQPPYFYQEKFRPHGKETKFIRFIMTQPKSDLFDQLYQLEPTMEFEVSYLRFSKFLKEIRPIEGYEYADGVPEILKQINSMYP